MSYNNTYDLASGSIAFGSQGGLGAFVTSALALQALYGTNMIRERATTFTTYP